MRIDPAKCVACANCVPICPMNAIAVDTSTNRAVIDTDECVECGTCLRGMSMEHLNPILVRAVRGVARLLRFRFEPEPDVCPTAAFVMDDLSWPRIVRQIFSDPLVEHESTGIHGRGTEEVKTNDVTGRIGVGEVGYVVEMGRPGVGVRFSQIQLMTGALAAMGVKFEERNPITNLMDDKSKGTLRPDILDEKILSAIVELKTPVNELRDVLHTVAATARKLETVTCVGVATRCSDDGEDTVVAPLLKGLDIRFHRAKTNMGLGRITN